MTSPPNSEGVTVICPECGDIIEVKDVRALLLSLHQTAVCPDLAHLLIRDG